jgi:hypothetical protein
VTIDDDEKLNYMPTDCSKLLLVWVRARLIDRLLIYVESNQVS